jgi:hypothetical protein
LTVLACFSPLAAALGAAADAICMNRRVTSGRTEGTKTENTAANSERARPRETESKLVLFGFLSSSSLLT